MKELNVADRWVEGDKVPEAPVPAAYAFEIGGILARMHALDVKWTYEPIEARPSRDWPDLAERAAATGQPRADELASQVETLLAIAHLVDTCERPGPIDFSAVQASQGGVRPANAPNYQAEALVIGYGLACRSIAHCAIVSCITTLGSGSRNADLDLPRPSFGLRAFLRYRGRMITGSALRHAQVGKPVVL